jgi:voltage-dependent potassium channel beta subunit
MQYRKLGNSGLKVSAISLGSWLTYGGYVEQENAIHSIHKAYELGINFFDTANVYEKGQAEIVMGEALRKYARESYVLATKVFWPMSEGPNDRGLSRKHIMEQCHASLRRLKTDYVDVYYCHRYDPQTPLEETMRALDDLVTQGKVLYVGVSEWTATQMAQALAIADKLLLDRIIVNQPIYNILNRYIEKEVIPFGEANGIGQVVFSPLAQGLLTGKYKSADDIPADSRAAKLDNMKKGITPEKIEQVNKLALIAEDAGCTVSELAIAWILRQNNVSSALVGASRPDQVESNVKALHVTLSPEIIERINQIS